MNISKRFIELCSKEDISFWTEERKLNLGLCKTLKIGYCDTEVYNQLMKEFDKDTLKNQGFITSGFKYLKRIIIPYSEDYFAARSTNRYAEHKNLFLKDITKKPFFIKGDDDICYITEGETDAIRLKHQYRDSSMFSLGGVTSYKLINQLQALFRGKRIIFAFDNDEAGKKCLDKCMQILESIKHNYQLFKLRFPDDYKDIDEYFFRGNSKKDLKLLELKEKSIYEIQNLKIRSLQSIFDNGIPKINWRIQNIIPERGIVFFGGKSGSYKTWIAMYAAMCCSLGKTFLDEYETKQCNVLYIDEENGDITLPYRFSKIKGGYVWLDHKFDNLQISIFNNLKLDNENHCKYIKGLIQEHNIKLIVIDSLVRCMEGEEDKSKHVRQIFDNLKNILEEYSDVSFLILHHTTKGRGNDIDNLRGSGDFAAFADVVLMFKRTKNFANVFIAKNRHIDLSKVSNFSIQAENTIEDNLRFKYLERNQDEKLAADDCYFDLKQWIDEENIKQFNTGKQSESYKIISKLGHSYNSINSAINKLCDDKIISKLSRGKYQVLSTIKEDNLTLN